MVVNMMTNKQTNTQNFPCMAVMMKTMPHSCYFLNQSFLDEIMMEAFSSVYLFLCQDDLRTVNFPTQRTFLATLVALHSTPVSK